MTVEIFEKNYRELCLNVPGVSMMEEEYKNPFEVPFLQSDNRWKKDSNKQGKKLSEQLKQSLREKKGASSKIKQQLVTAKSVKKFVEQEKKKAEEYTKILKPGYVEPSFILDLTKDIHRLGEKSAEEYVSRNKTILKDNHALERKLQEISKMKEQADKAEEDVAKEEERLERDAVNFNDFIYSMSSLTDDAIQNMVNETKVKFQKIEEASNLKTESFLLNSDISYKEKLLSNYLTCYNFLKAAKPQTIDWDALDLNMPLKDILDFQEDEIPETSSVTESTPNIFNEDSDDIPIHVPFKDAYELLQSIDRFRNQNLSIITNSHYVKSSLRDAQEKYNRINMELETSSKKLKKQIDDLMKEIEDAIDETTKLEEISNKAVLQSVNEEKMFQENITPQVESVYETCCGVKGDQLNLTMMVGTIESHLLKLILDIQKLPEKVVYKVHKQKQVERQMQKKKDDDERRKRAQEERSIKREKCAQEDPKLKLERRLMYAPKLSQQVSERKKSMLSTSDETRDEDFFISE